MLLLIKTCIGILAGIGTTISFLPQLVKIVRSGSTDGLSHSMFLIHTSGVTLWVVYGIIGRDLIVITFNAMSCFFCLVILSYIIQDWVYKPSEVVIDELV
jgi:MtN3 and saliva related transmembrane protein